MKKTLAVLGTAALLSAAGTGIANAQGENEETPADEQTIAQTLCGTVGEVDALGSVEGILPGLAADDCEANVDEALSLLLSGDFQGAIDLLTTGEAPEEGEEGGEAGSLEGLLGSSDDAEGEEGGETTDEGSLEGVFGSLGSSDDAPAEDAPAEDDAEAGSLGSIGS